MTQTHLFSVGSYFGSLVRIFIGEWKDPLQEAKNSGDWMDQNFKNFNYKKINWVSKKI